MPGFLLNATTHSNTALLYVTAELLQTPQSGTLYMRQGCDSSSSLPGDDHSCLVRVAGVGWLLHCIGIAARSSTVGDLMVTVMCNRHLRPMPRPSTNHHLFSTTETGFTQSFSHSW